MKSTKKKSLSWLIPIFLLIAFCNGPSRALAQDDASELEQVIAELENEAEKLSAEMAALRNKDPDDPEIVSLESQRNAVSTALLGYQMELANLKGAEKKSSDLALQTPEQEESRKLPRVFSPWEIPDSLSYAYDDIRFKEKMYQLREINESPPDRTRDFFVRQIDVRPRAHAFYENTIKAMYVLAFKKSWNALGLSDGELAPRVNRIATGFSTGYPQFTRALDAVRSQLDKGVFPENTSGECQYAIFSAENRAAAVPFDEIRKRHREAQERLRQILKLRYDKWDKARFVAWQGKLDIQSRIIRDIELHVVTMNILKDLDKERLQAFVRDVKLLKRSELAPRDAKVMRSFVRREFFVRLREDIRNFGSPTGEMKNIGASIEVVDRFKDKYQGEYGGLLTQRDAVANTLREKITGWYCALMTEGIDQALESGLKLHRTSNTDNTYRNIIGTARWELYRERIDYLNEEKVYREFLPGDEEWRVFQEQDALREELRGKL